MRPVDLFKGALVGGVEGRQNNVCFCAILSDVGPIEQCAVCQYCYGNIGDFFYAVDEVAETGVESWLAGTADSNIVRGVYAAKCCFKLS